MISQEIGNSGDPLPCLSSDSLCGRLSIIGTPVASSQIFWVFSFRGAAVLASSVYTKLGITSGGGGDSAWGENSIGRLFHFIGLQGSHTSPTLDSGLNVRAVHVTVQIVDTNYIRLLRKDQSCGWYIRHLGG